MIFTCDTCHYVFTDEKQQSQCPDCGKFTIRPATNEEKQELMERDNQKEKMWGSSN